MSTINHGGGGVVKIAKKNDSEGLQEKIETGGSPRKKINQEVHQ